MLIQTLGLRDCGNPINVAANSALSSLVLRRFVNVFGYPICRASVLQKFVKYSTLLPEVRNLLQLQHKLIAHFLSMTTVMTYSESPTQPVSSSSSASSEAYSSQSDGVTRLLDHVATLPAIAVAVAHPCDETSLASALDAHKRGLIEPILIAPRSKLQSVADEHELDISTITIEDVPHSHAAAVRAVELAATGKVEALMKGSLHTDELMGEVVASRSGLRTKHRVSHCFILQTRHYPRPFIVTDAAINLAPNLLQKADIVRNAIALAHTIGVDEPKVAILAAVETVSPTMPATLDAAALCKMADRGQITGALLDGPLAFDNAVSLDAAHTKGIHSAVAGQADILVVPDLESGNMLAKQLMYMGEASSAGIVMGAKVPIVLTSRADSHLSRIASCAIAVMLAHRYRQDPP